MNISEQLKDALRSALAPEHDNTTHEFSPSLLEPGQCQHCGWLNPEGPVGSTGITAHAAATKVLSGLEDGTVTIGEPIIVRVIIMPSPFDLWSYPFAPFWS